MSREKILSFVKQNGPVIPSQIGKELKTSILFASAMLSELVARKELKVSSLKIGGSPLYYIPGQEIQLEKYTDKLDDKEYQSFKLLQERRILRDKEQTPLHRVTLRAIKDFAIPLEVSFNNQTELFWKWYKLDADESETIIKNMLTGKSKNIPFEQVAQVKKPLDATGSSPIEKKKGSTESTTLKGPAVPKSKKEKKDTKPPKKSSNFEQLFQQFTVSNKCTLKEVGSKKKGETEGIIEFESPIGKVIFYFITRDKKSITEKDISEAYAQGQLKQLPTVLFSSGTLNKKGSQQMLQFKSVYFKQLEA